MNIDYKPAGPVVEQFHRSSAFVRGLMGPVGSSKSSATWMEIVSRATEQKPNQQRIRKSRWAVIRNTYPELKSTTIKTAQDWMPVMELKWDAPITGKLDFWLPDKTRVQAEIIFLAMDRPEDRGKLKGLEVTGAWLNEAVELPKEVLDMAIQRTGRFPSIRDGGPTWNGVILDTNPPDSDHWWFKIFEEQKPEGWEIYKQPGGLVEEKGQYLPNPLAENIPNLPNGHEYYLRQVAGKTKEWIKVFLMGQYGTVIDGKPVYPEYNDDLHCREIKPIPNRPLLVGLDYGLTPAAVICQLSPRGQLLVLDELCSEDMGISQFARDVLKPHLATEWAGYGFNAVGDPAGTRRADGDEKTCFQALADEGIAAAPAISNDFLKRREAVAKYLTRLTDGNPALLVHPRCTRVRKGFMGGYCFKRLQVGGEKYRDVADKNLYSHCFVAGTMVSVPGGVKPIEEIRAGDYIITPNGLRIAERAWLSRKNAQLVQVELSNGQVLTGTPDHKIVANAGRMRLDALQYGDVLWSIQETWDEKPSILFWSSTVGGITASLLATTKQITRKAANTCIGLSGRITTALSRISTTFIIKTATRATTTFPTWNASIAQNTLESTLWNGLHPIQSLPYEESPLRESLRAYGIGLKQVSSGTENMAAKPGSDVHPRAERVFNVVSNTWSWLEPQSEDIAPLLANRRRGVQAALMMLIGHAKSAAARFGLIATPKPKPAVKVVGVKHLPDRKDVYDLTVSQDHVFFANGVLVHNCHDALQYAALHTQFMDTESFNKPIRYKEVYV